MKKRGVLILIAAIIVVLLLAFAVLRTVAERSLGVEVRRAVSAYRTGVLNPDGTTTQSLSDALYLRLNASDRLLTLAAKYDEVYDEYSSLRTAYNEMLAEVKSGPDFGAIQAANTELGYAFDVCYSALLPLVSGKSAETLASCADDLDAAQNAVDAAGEAYNVFIRSFREDTLKKFPNSFMKLFLKTPEPALWPNID